jgi:hypothetical protein
MDSKIKTLKRSSGKFLGNIKKEDFFKFYKDNSKDPVDKKIYNAFMKELLTTYMEKIILEGEEIRLGLIGRVRVRSNQLKVVKDDGTLAKSLKPNWQLTWEYWFKKYEGKTKEEIINISDKTVIYHENEHSHGEFYDFFWDKVTANVKYKSLFKFVASRQYKRLLSSTVKSKERKVFYYG